MTPHTETLEGIDSIIEDQLHFLRPVAECWQPSDLLPDLSRADWRERVEGLRDKAATLSDEVLVVLVGNIVTEEALPSYQTWLNRNEGLEDETGASDTPWGRWSRGWTAEENRHGELLSRYLYLSGRVDMRKVEITIQHLIRNGFDLKSGGDPYKSLVYASFQERATKISHANTGRLAERCGDDLLNRMCALIASDEARHEEAYKRMYGRVIEIDRERAVLAFAGMMRQKIAMPARLMSDGGGGDLFAQFVVTAQRSQIYTTLDYSEVISHLLDFWKIPTLTGLTGAAAEAQEYLCNLPAHFLSKADKTRDLVARMAPDEFAWIFNRTA